MQAEGSLHLFQIILALYIAKSRFSYLHRVSVIALQFPCVKIFFSLIIFAALFFTARSFVFADTTPQGSGFVTTQGTHFMLGGSEFKFVGFNMFDAANTYFPDQNKMGYSCPRDNGWWTNIYTEADLDKEMAYMRDNAGATVIRLMAFQRYTNNATDWSGIDKVIRLAKKDGFKLLLVLEDGPGFCTFPVPQGFSKWKYNSDTWYSDGYKQIMGSYVMTYPEYVRTIVTRYKDEPAILGWMMMNEADTSLRVAGEPVLVNFAKDIGGIIKGIDKNHLVTVGTQSNGASGGSGKDFPAIYGLPVVDFGEIHDYAYWGGDAVPLPGSPDGATLPSVTDTKCQPSYISPLACSIAYSLAMNKPIIIGESGILAKNPASRAVRAGQIDKKMNSFFNVGGVGYLIWQMNKVIDQGYDVQDTTNDPLLPVMKKYAGMSLYASMGGSPTPSPSVSPTPSPSPTLSPSPSPSVSPTPQMSPSTTPSPTPSIIPSPTPSASPAVCVGDINGDGKVDLIDYSLLISNFFQQPLLDPRADLNGDGKVDLIDYSILLNNLFTKCP